MLKSRANQLVVKATSAKGGRKSTDQLASLARQPKPIKRKVGFQSAETVRPSRAARSGARLDVGSIQSQSGVDLTEKLRELLVLAKEQGHLTCDDITQALPEGVGRPEDLDQIYSKLRPPDIA